MTTSPGHGGHLRWAATIADCNPAEIIDFSASINPLGIPQTVRVAIEHSLDTLVHYPDPDCWALRQALSQHHNLPPDWILVGNGAAELLTWIARDLQPLGPVGVITPGFGDYGRALRAFDVPITPCPLPVNDPHKLVNPPGLDDLIPKHLTSLLLNNPHNPTGCLWSRAALQALLATPRDLVVVDEAFMDFLPPESEQSLISLVQDYPQLVILRSLTKFYALPGLRIGYVIAPPDRIQKWQQWRDPWSVNSLALVAGTVAIQDREFQTQTWAWLPRARQELMAGLEAIPGLTVFPSAANFLLIKLSGSAVALQQQLLHQARILIRDCLSFPELGPAYFRVAVRSPAENQALIAAIRQHYTCP